MTRKVPGLLRIECRVASRPLRSAWVTVTLPMESKNPYHLLFGPSDHRGVVEVDGDALLAAAREEHKLALMDYVTFPDGWTGEIHAKVLDLADITRLRSAMKTWGSDRYPRDLVLSLEEYEAHIRETGDDSLSAEISTH